MKSEHPTPNTTVPWKEDTDISAFHRSPSPDANPEVGRHDPKQNLRDTCAVEFVLIATHTVPTDFA